MPNYKTVFSIEYFKLYLEFLYNVSFFRYYLVNWLFYWWYNYYSVRYSVFFIKYGPPKKLNLQQAFLLTALSYSIGYLVRHIFSSLELSITDAWKYVWNYNDRVYNYTNLNETPSILVWSNLYNRWQGYCNGNNFNAYNECRRYAAI